MRGITAILLGLTLLVAVWQWGPADPAAGRAEGPPGVAIAEVASPSFVALAGDSSAALLLHGKGVSEVPSASCLREYNATRAEEGDISTTR